MAAQAAPISVREVLSVSARARAGSGAGPDHLA